MNQLGRIALILGLLLGLCGASACGEAQPGVSPHATALLVIDVQNAYVDQLDLATIDGVQLIDKLVEILAVARAAGLPIVYVRHRDPMYPEGSPALECPSAISPLPGDLIVWKAHQNAFDNSELAVVLTRLGVRRLLLTGLTTGGVSATAFGAKAHGYETWVVADAHAGGGSGAPERYNGFWPKAGIFVKPSEELDFASLALQGAAMAEARGAEACTTALVVIDVQNAYVDQLDLTTIDGAQLVDKLVEVLATARAAGLPIVYIKHRDPGYREGSPALDNPAAIEPLPGDRVVWKAQPSAFVGTELDDVLIAIGAYRLILTGLATTGCVNATAVGAIALGYETWIVKDANAGGGPPNTIARYNESSWPDAGLIVRLSADVDFAAFGCFAPQP